MEDGGRAEWYSLPLPQKDIGLEGGGGAIPCLSLRESEGYWVGGWGWCYYLALPEGEDTGLSVGGMVLSAPASGGYWVGGMVLPAPPSGGYWVGGMVLPAPPSGGY